MDLLAREARARKWIGKGKVGEILRPSGTETDLAAAETDLAAAETNLAPAETGLAPAETSLAAAEKNLAPVEPDLASGTQYPRFF